MHGCLLITIGLINMDRSNVGNPIKKIKKSMVITCKILKWTTPLLVVVLNISNIEQIFSNSTYGQWQIQATWAKLIWCINCAHSVIENRVLEKMNLWWAYIALVSKKKKKKNRWAKARSLWRSIWHKKKIELSKYNFVFFPSTPRGKLYK